MIDSRGVIQTYQCLAPASCHPSLPRCWLLLAQAGPVWTCSPWEQTERPAQWSRMEQPLRTPTLETKTHKNKSLKAMRNLGNVSHLQFQADMTRNTWCCHL